MKCDDIFELLLSGGKLSDEANAHVAGCRDCQSLQEAVSVLSEAGDNARKRDVSEATVDAVLAGAREIHVLKNRPPHTRMTELWFLRGLAAAAALFVLIGAGAMLIQHLLLDDETPSISAADLAGMPAGGMDEQMAEARHNVGRFRSRYSERIVLAGMDSDMTELRERLSLATIGMEHELAGLK